MAAGQNGGAVASYTRGITLVLDVGVCAVFLLLGWLAGRKHAWAFVIGMVFYGFDTLILLLARGWWGVLFHALVLSKMWVGLSSLRKLRAAEAVASQPLEPGSVPLVATQADGAEPVNG